MEGIQNTSGLLEMAAMIQQFAEKADEQFARIKCEYRKRIGEMEARIDIANVKIRDLEAANKEYEEKCNSLYDLSSKQQEVNDKLAHELNTMHKLIELVQWRPKASDRAVVIYAEHKTAGKLLAWMNSVLYTYLAKNGGNKQLLLHKIYLKFDEETSDMYANIAGCAKVAGGRARMLFEDSSAAPLLIDAVLAITEEESK